MRDTLPCDMLYALAVYTNSIDNRLEHNVISIVKIELFRATYYIFLKYIMLLYAKLKFNKQ